MNKSRSSYVLITRPDPEGSELCDILNARHIPAKHLPTLAFTPPPDAVAFQQALAKLGEQDWLIFISPQAVYRSVPAIRQQWPHFPPSVKFAALGRGTARALQAAGYQVEIYPQADENSETLLDLPVLQKVAGKNIAIVRGADGRELVDKILSERGANVLPVIVYARVLPEIDITPTLTLFAQRKINLIVCTSFTGVENLKLLFSEANWPLIKSVPLLVVSERIKVLAQALGFQTIWVTPSASQAAILAAIEQGKDGA